MTQARKGDWCQTFTGRAVYPLDMHPEDVDLLDIAHSLALQCRFTGHCRKFYSVAEHSIRVEAAVLDSLHGHKLSSGEGRAVLCWALLHDAAEAYMKDIPRPVKRSIVGWREVETAIEEAIAKRFELELPIPKIVLHADSVLLAAEARDLMAPPPQAWEQLPEPSGGTIHPLPWAVAEARFLLHAARLGLAEIVRDGHKFNAPGDRWFFTILSVCGRPVAVETFLWDVSAMRRGSNEEESRRIHDALPKGYVVDTRNSWGAHGSYGYDVVPAEER